MSVGPLGIVGSVATAPAAARSSDVDRTQGEVAEQARQSVADIRADNAAGIGETDGEEHAAAERDADGRRLWEPPDAGDARPQQDSIAPPPRKSKDATGQSGQQLDLTG